MAAAVDEEEVLRVTFHPPLYLQRQIWILDILRRENVQSVLDIGCGEGSLLQCLAEPSYTLPPTTSLPTTSPFVTGSSFGNHQLDLYLNAVHGLDPHGPSLEVSILGAASPSDKLPFTGYDRWKRREARWMPLEVNIWQGGFEYINPAFQGDKIDAFVASEVIEHLTPELFPLFAPIILGHYRPRLLLLTTPNFTYNQRFSRPGEFSPTGYLDPTGRTRRTFRHHDHKFEWTTEEWTKYCTDSASKFGYNVALGGVGLAVEPDPWHREGELGFASNVAVFHKLEAELPQTNILDFINNDVLLKEQHRLRARYIHQPHPLSLEELSHPSDVNEVHEAVKKAMNDYGKQTLTFSELWGHGMISLICKGDIGALVLAFDKQELDPEKWAVEDEAKAWEATVTWKEIGTQESRSLDEDRGWPANVRGEENLVDDSFRVNPTLTEVDGEEQEMSLPDPLLGEALGQTHWGWHDADTEACGWTGEKLWCSP